MSDRGRLTGRRAIVTGGSRGIGFSIAEALADRGVELVLCARGADGLERALQKLSRPGRRVLGRTCDVGDEGQVEDLVRFADSELGGLDILINNAGIGIFRTVEEMTPEEWRTLMRTNVDSLFYCCHHALPIMRRGGGGAIVNIGSLAGKNAFPRGAAYCASKFAVTGFSEALMQEVRYDDIRVAYVMPGSVNTGFSGKPPAQESWKVSPEEVAQVVVEILSRDSGCLSSCIEIRPSKPPR